MVKTKKESVKSARQVFVTVGTHPQQFNRLLEEVDRLTGDGKISGKVFAQTGKSTYRPKNFDSKAFVTIEEFKSLMNGSDVIITHAGEGNIGLAKNTGKKMVVVPRRKEFGEHTNDHQLELARVVEQKRLGLVAWDVHELAEKLMALDNFMPAKVERGKINEILKDYLRRDLGW